VRRWLFADQLGPHFLDDPNQPVLLIESTRVLGRRRFHRQKAHLVLSALRHRATELGEQAQYVRVTRYADALDARGGEPLEVPHPTSWEALDLVERRPEVTVVPTAGFACPPSEFVAWADSRGSRRLLMDDFYRGQRRRFDVLMDGSEPRGNKWNLDHDNREPPPKRAVLGAADPWWPVEDEIDAEVRRDLDAMQASGEASFVGRDGPRLFAATRAEALAALEHFVRTRLPGFGPHEDAMLAADWTMSHSLLSAPLNLGLLSPLEVVRAAEAAYLAGDAPLNSVEGFVRQVLGWREYIWQLYWYEGREFPRRNALEAHVPLPDWFRNLDADAVQARCLSGVLGGVRDRGWVHHIPRLMVLGNYGLQRGWDPAELARWFHESFVDGYAWVMVSNVVGMSQHADGGVLATKPYAAGGAYIDRMSDYCGGCAYNPKVRVGETACPYTAGYWSFLDRQADRLAGNPRMRRALDGRHRLKDLGELLDQEQARGSAAP